MQTFWSLPYTATVPWPVCSCADGQLDWITSVESIELWLDQHVGQHDTHWTWNLWTLHNPDVCSIRFARAGDTTMFLLRWAE